MAEGQSLGRIAKRYKVTVDALRERNRLEAGGRKIQPGDKLVIPAPPKAKRAPSPSPKEGAKPGPGEQAHEVVSGDSLGRIARRYATTVNALRDRNGLEKGGRKIQPGDVLIIPKPAKRTEAPAQSKRAAAPKRGNVRCPGDMVSVFGNFCIDRYEAYVAIILEGGKLKVHSPYEPVGKKTNIKALNRRGRVPQAHISRDQAELACKNAGKRLCTDDEWITACKGKSPTTWPYGEDHKPKRCNDAGVSSFQKYYGPEGGGPAPQSAYTWENLNDSRLNQAAGTLAPSGKFSTCQNSFKIHDMVGNLHEWTAAPTGTFRGGYYLDVKQHGHGCNYKTTAHNAKYHDYSTGFRCCKG